MDIIRRIRTAAGRPTRQAVEEMTPNGIGSMGSLNSTVLFLPVHRTSGAIALQTRSSSAGTPARPRAAEYRLHPLQCELLRNAGWIRQARWLEWPEPQHCALQNVQRGFRANG